MLLKSIHQLVRYNLWANGQLAGPLQTLTEDQFQTAIPSSFPSVLKTVVHLHAAEDVWRQRLCNVRPSLFYQLPENTGGASETSKWLDASRVLTSLVLSFDENALVETVDYLDGRGTSHSNFRWQMIQHCVNHSSYHRGQLVTMLRQVGVMTIPSTDLIAYHRLTEAANGSPR